MDHRSYRPVTPCSNKFLQKRWDQRYYEEHRKKVMEAKPMVDATLPKPHSHLDTKYKKLQLERERREVAQKDNANLLHKMQHIMLTHGYVDHHHSYQHHSLNASKRLRDQQQMTQENMAMLKRLQEVQPMYRVSEWVADWDKKEQLVQSITAYPTASRVSSAKRAHTKAATSNKGSRSSSQRATPSPAPTSQKGRLLRIPPVDEDQLPPPPLPPLVRVSSPSELPEKVEEVAKALEKLTNVAMETQDSHHDRGDPKEQQTADDAHSNHGDYEDDHGDYEDDHGDYKDDHDDYKDDHDDFEDDHDDHSDLSNSHNSQGDANNISGHSDPYRAHASSDAQALTNDDGATI